MPQRLCDSAQLRGLQLRLGGFHDWDLMVAPVKES